jgi:cytochrome o ubiquinol oxidase subunit 1
MLGIPPLDFQVHNSLFLVAHFHSNVIGGVLFGIFAGISYWFPKLAGFRLNERIGKYAFWCWIGGFSLSFIPMYILGLMGATRRLDTYDASTGWQPFYVLMFIGGVVIAIGTALQLAQIIASVIQKRRLHDSTGDPWDGRTLEWSVPSPAPSYNFPVIPQVTTRDAFWEMKKQGLSKPKYVDIHMPKNTASGIYISILAFLVGFGFVWEIIWMVVIGIIGIIGFAIARTFNEHTEYTITAAEVEKLEKARLKKEQAARAAMPANTDPEEDMGLWELIKIIALWAWNVVRRRQWRTWQKQ